MNRIRRPFTLIELLCVIVVIAMLAAISIKITQIAYRRADETKTKTILEIIRTSNEQYKAKYGYYHPNGKTKLDDGYYSLPLEEEFLGEAYDTCKALSSTDIVDAWGNQIRYRCPGKFNPNSYDVYSLGRDKGVGDAESGSSMHDLPGAGDDIANFKHPKSK